MDAMLKTALALVALWPILLGAGCGTPTDREVLVTFYEATDGPNWYYQTNWLSDKPLSEWTGVGTNAEGRVTGLNMGWSLTGNGLRGEIPAELGNLTELRSLNLSGNQLTGEVPKELGKLSNLHSLDLYRNRLTGEIPKELRNLTRLSYLALGYNDLEGCWPPELMQPISKGGMILRPC